MHRYTYTETELAQMPIDNVLLIGDFFSITLLTMLLNLKSFGAHRT